MHYNPQLFKVSIIQTKLFGPLDFELSRFHCNLYKFCCLSADEFKPHEDDGSGNDDEDDDVSSGVDENEVTSDSASEPESPVKVCCCKHNSR